jgi:hypothetical protein
MTFWKFFTTRYTDHLEQENAELKRQLGEERAEVKRLTEVAIPGLHRYFTTALLREPDRNARPSMDIGKPAHHITKWDNNYGAECTCGWKVDNGTDENPMELQEEISKHYRLAMPPIRQKATTLSDIRRAREAQSEQEAAAESKKENRA